MSEVKNFEFGAKKTEGEIKAIASFKINGEQYQVRAMRGVSLMYLINKMKNGRNQDDQIAAFLEFADSALLPESAKRLEKLILEQDNGVEFEAPELIQVLTHIVQLAAAGEKDETPAKPKPGPRVRRTA